MDETPASGAGSHAGNAGAGDWVRPLHNQKDRDWCTPPIAAGRYPAGRTPRYLTGELASRCGRHQEAIHILTRCVERYQSIGHLVHLARAQIALGWALLGAREVQRAHEALTEGLVRARQIQARSWEARALEGLGAAAADRGHLEEAEVLCGTARAIRKETGAHYWVIDRAVQHRPGGRDASRPYQV
jgi:hypothetical protein